jgi:hypothetical protein
LAGLLTECSSHGIGQILTSGSRVGADLDRVANFG